MKITSPKSHASHLTRNEDALQKCQLALELKDRGNFDGSLDAMRPIWRKLGQRPAVEELHPVGAGDREPPATGEERECEALARGANLFRDAGRSISHADRWYEASYARSRVTR